MIRALRPTDATAFLSFRARAPANEALLGPMSQAPKVSFREFLGRALALKPGHETWVQIEHGQIYGLIAARARLGTDVWDIDHLAIAPMIDDDRVCLRLLGHLCEAAVDEGVQKVFLRLRDGSPWAAAARQAGVVQYTTEKVFVLATLPPMQRPPFVGLRPRRPADHQSLFQLYSATVPAHVRQIEALTLQEWRWTDNWGLVTVAPIRSALPRRRRDLVVQVDDQLTAWIQIHLHGRTARLLHDGRHAAEVGLLIDRAVAELPAGRAAAFAVREYQSELIAPLEDRGFTEVETQLLLARVLTARIPERRLVPARVV